MVCHGCYDAPCQLKMEARIGLERGASKALVYDGSRLVEAETTRLFNDAQTPQEWREKGFYPVLDSEDPGQGVLYRMLQLKQAHPLDPNEYLPETFDFSLARDQQCPKPEEFDQFQSEFPQWGMPYGMPGLPPAEHETLITWLEQGAPAHPEVQTTDAEIETIQQWETFLNGDSNKQRLMSRYVYEHLFLANLYFEKSDSPRWFRLVRSSTAPGEPLQLISTRRPYDDPGVERVYYRLQRMSVTPLRKNHMPYLFDRARMEWYERLFLQPDYEIAKLPGYGEEHSANPFDIYQDVPVRSRYEFLLREAQFTIMNFIKGPVCRGRVALNVIDDHFWVMFESPELIDARFDQEFLAQESANLMLPQSRTGTAIDIFSWRKYSKAHMRYLKARSEYAALHLERQPGLKINYSAIWDGEGSNDNAALTIFRHSDTASVVKGWVGELPKTAWVIDYPLLERIHYLLVAGFDVFGSLSHQLESRLYMDFLRLEGELGFLVFMPKEEAKRLARYWYRDTSDGILDYVERANLAQIDITGIDFASSDPKREFLETLRGKIYGAADTAYDYRKTAGKRTIAGFEQLENNVGEHNQYLPSVSFVNLVGADGDEVYTLIRNTGYSNIAEPFNEEGRRLPKEDSATVVTGFIGGYPNQFFEVEEAELQRFLDDIAALGSAQDYDRLLKRFGVQRNMPEFWEFSDKIHSMQEADGPIKAGLFDYGRYNSYQAPPDQ